MNGSFFWLCIYVYQHGLAEIDASYKVNAYVFMYVCCLTYYKLQGSLRKLVG